jgi:hypothetical protein
MKTFHDFFPLVFMIFPVIVLVAFYRGRFPKQKVYSYHVAYFFNNTGYGSMTLQTSIPMDTADRVKTKLRLYERYSRKRYKAPSDESSNY